MIPLTITANLDIDPWTDLLEAGLPHNPDGVTARIRAHRRPAQRDGNDRGNNTTRRQRREWLVATYRANVDLLTTELALILGEPIEVALGQGEPACRCYRCGDLLTVDTVTADRINPGCNGGKYRTPRQDKREGVTNIRPACAGCNSTTGGALATRKKRGAR